MRKHKDTKVLAANDANDANGRINGFFERPFASFASFAAKTFVSLCFLTIPPYSTLEIQTTTDHKPSLSGCGSDAPEGGAGAAGTGYGGSGSGRDAGTGAVDVHVGNVKIGMIQHIDCIHAKFELFGFGNPHTLDQVGIEPQQRRSLDRVPAKIADLSRSGIHENKPALGINNRLVAERSAESVKR